MIPFQYKDAAQFDGGLAPVDQNDKWGFVDKTGKVAIPLTFDDVRSFTEGLAAAKSGNKWGYIDTKGAYVIQPQYQSRPGHFQQGLAAVLVGTKWQYVDKTGKKAFEQTFDDAMDFSEGLAAVKVGGKWGFIDTTGRTVIQPQFALNYMNSVDPSYSPLGFRGGLAAVTVAGGDKKSMQYIDKTGKVIIDLDDTAIGLDFEGPLAQVSMPAGDWTYIDQSGKVVLSCPAPPQ